MSACFSVTVITSVETRLKAATATISARMMNIMRFSTCTAANQLRFCRVQSRTSRLGGRVLASCAATSGARCMSVSLSRTPVGPSIRNSRCGVADVYQRQRAVVFVVARVERPRQRELLEPRHDARRRDLALRRDQRDLLAEAHAERPRELAAQHDAELAVLQGGQRLPPYQRSDVRHRRLCAGFDTANQNAAHRIAARQQGLRVDVGRGADDLRVAARLALDLTPVDRIAARQILRRARPPTACGHAPATRSRSSPKARRSGPSRRAQCPASKCPR